MSKLDDYCKEEFWNLNVTWDTENPDFTPCFQYTVLSWLPIGVLLLLGIPEVIIIARKTKKPRLNVTVITVFKTLSILLAMGSTIYKAIRLEDEPSDTIAHLTGLLVEICGYFASLLFLGFFSWRGEITSASLFIFYLVDAICSSIKFRSFFLREGSEAGLFPAEVCVLTGSCLSLIAVCWADFPTEPEYLSDERPCTYGKASFLNKLVFSYCTPLIVQGFKKPLDPTNLWNILPNLKSKSIAEDFDNNYFLQKQFEGSRSPASNLELRTIKKISSADAEYPVPDEVIGVQRRQERRKSIFPALVRTFGPIFLLGSIIKIGCDMMSLYTPQVMKLMISFAESHTSEVEGQKSEEDWKGYFYGGLLLVTVTAQSLLLNFYFEKMFVVGLKLRSALISIIYRKSLIVTSAAKRESTVGEIVNLMSIDVQRFMDVLPYLNMLWSAPLQIALSTYYMYNELGNATFVGMAVMIPLLGLNFQMGKVMRGLQLKQMKLKDSRIKLMNEVLNGIKVLKLYAWEKSFIGQILEIRSKEVRLLKKSAYYQAFMSLFWTISPFLVGLGAFTFYVLYENEPLTPQKAFVTLSYLNIIRMPLAFLPMLVVFLIQVNVSMQRINKFLNNEELDPDCVTHSSSKYAVSIENGEFKWSSEEPTVLHDINMNIPKGSLVAVVGSVGAGKSSLLSAILGELHKEKGLVNSNGRIAYVPQQAWIQNSTLKGNIEFCAPRDDTFYEQVISACALKSDFDILPAGDQTEIGEKGINLSGGQKQRVSLARAVFSRADLFLFDDPLSAVDSHVGKHIFEEVLGPNGILKNKTRLLVTHGITYLSKADHIIVLKDGNICEQGDYDTLLAKKGELARFMIAHLEEEADSDFSEDVKEKLKEAIGEEEFERQLDRQRSRKDSIHSTSSYGSMTGSVSSDKGMKDPPEKKPAKEEIKTIGEANKNPNAAGTKLIEKESVNTGGVKFKVYKYYFSAIGIIGVVIAVSLQAVYTGLSVLTNFWLTWWTSNRFGDMNEERNFYIGVYGGLGAGQALATMILAMTIALITLTGSTILHEKMLMRIMMSPMTFFDTTPLGRIVNRFAKDVDVCDSTLPGNLRSWLSTFSNFAATMISIIAIMPLYIVVVIPVAIVFFILQTFYVRTSRQLKRIESTTRSPIYSHFGETISGTSTIRAFGREREFIQLSEEKVDYNQVCYYPSIVANRWLAVRLEAIGNLITFGAALFSIIGTGTINASEVGFVISNSLNVTQVLNWLVRMTADVETNIVGVERIMEYSELPLEAPWVVPELRPESGWPLAGQVKFSDFSLRYREGLDLVLKKINCSMMGGEKIGIVGRTGAGKSSLTVALFRIVEAAEGSIEIDDVNISKIGLHDLRNQLTIIPQDPVLFSGNLRMNLDPFKRYDDTQVWQALEHSNLKTFVKSLEKGLEHEISEGGENISVGQRQLVCLARALLRKTKVLILDEATAAVDMETDELIQKTIRKEFADCTVLTIAHRLNTIMDYDKIMVLDKGELMEFDSPDNLLADKTSIFYGLAKDADLVDK